MPPAQFARAAAAAAGITASFGLVVEDVVPLNLSNAITLRLLPCDVVARVAPREHQVAAFEVAIAGQLAERGSPVARLDPRVPPRPHERDGFVVTVWTHYAPVPGRAVAPAEYAEALRRLHAGMREVDVPAPRFTQRVEQARRLLADRERTPALSEADREFLGHALSGLGRAVRASAGAEQLLHGEPHPGNLLATRQGALFIDFETCCRGPVEFDLAHAPEDVAAHHPGVDRDLLSRCRMLVLAMITSWRWDREDRFPDGPRLGEQWLDQLRAVLDRSDVDLRG
ncbi:phosphotransferase [Kineococcus indalonis]|uniref:phosphotransferase n=1 Tax=Kineococcus indalonis TaxID=2696566 RepID=UPI001412D300|nr:phosphotransferase [Kineococcus indalonis]